MPFYIYLGNISHGINIWPYAHEKCHTTVLTIGTYKKCIKKENKFF